MLAAPEPAEKIALSHAVAEAWRAGEIAEIGDTRPPDRPARPARPTLLPPREMPKRRAGGERESRIALLHALAHIELNAIDLAWDLIARFASEHPPRAFFDDWVAVADEEAMHHGLIAERLGALGAAYGDLPAHDGLWEAAAHAGGGMGSMREPVHSCSERLRSSPSSLFPSWPDLLDGCPVQRIGLRFLTGTAPQNHARACHGHPRFPLPDARDKHAHDAVEEWSTARGASP